MSAAYAATLLREIDRINLHRRDALVDLVAHACGDELLDADIAILGAAFKPGSDDVRDSPALAVAAAIQQRGANITVYDPQALDNAQRAYPALTYATTITDACNDADVVVLLTEWDQFRMLHPDDLTGIVRHRSIIDGRNSLDPAPWRAAEWTYHAPGLRT
ncbi:nucleotide sugar dehydrogenase [Nocardia sp. GAS34]|uniref:UDP binding domain-containing protein n=1 Tax=unclassified Nocardia TaxID=2637762 RepID=UPI003D1AC490